MHRFTDNGDPGARCDGCQATYAECVEHPRPCVTRGPWWATTEQPSLPLEWS